MGLLRAATTIAERPAWCTTGGAGGPAGDPPREGEWHWNFDPTELAMEASARCRIRSRGFCVEVGRRLLLASCSSAMDASPGRESWIDVIEGYPSAGDRFGVDPTLRSLGRATVTTADSL